MGIQNIIKNPQEGTPSADSFLENGPFFNEAEPPVVIDMYSDGSDTESFSELQDADDLLSILTSWSTEEDQDFRIPSPVFSVEMEQGEHLLRELLQEASTTANVCNSNSTPAVNVNKQVGRTKKSTIKSRRGNMGKKKARRFENARQLALLAEDDRAKYDESDFTFMSFECSFRFTQILEDTDLANKILNSTFDDIDEFCFDMNIEKHSQKKKTAKMPVTDRTLSPDEAFNNLDTSQKSFIKRRNLPMGMIEYLDTCVFSFFENNPTGTYISEPLTSFQRMVIHCIAQYYDLNSRSFDAEDRIERLTQITNAFNYFKPPCLCLSQYLEKHLGKNLNFDVRRILLFGVCYSEKPVTQVASGLVPKRKNEIQQQGRGTVLALAERIINFERIAIPTTYLQDSTSSLSS